MIKKIDITNGYGETLSLDLFQPELSGFAVREISGLGPVQATVSMADYASKPGGRFQGSRLGTREISFDLVFLDSLASIEQVRHQSYRYFPIGEKIEMTFTTDEREVTTTGYVENNEPAIWDSEFEGATIDVVCESPFLKGKDMIIKNLAAAYKSFHFPFSSLKEPELLFGYIKVGNDIQITNDGEQECGCIFNIIALEDFSNPLIYNDLDGTYFGLMINVDEGDTIVVNTRIGEKSAKLIRNGQSINVISFLKPGSTWFTLKKGVNQFSIGQADTYTKSIGEDNNHSLVINADRKNYEVNEIRMVTPLKQSKPNEASSKKAKEIKSPSGFKLEASKTFWRDNNTDTKKYDVDSKSVIFSYSIKTLFKYAIDENGNRATNIAPSAFGAGYLSLSYEHENQEDDSKEEKQMGLPKLVMTHVKIPYYTSDKKISPSWTFSNTYNKGVKYTYAKMKFSSCAFAYNSSAATNSYKKIITLAHDYPGSPYTYDGEWRNRPCYDEFTFNNLPDYVQYDPDDQFLVTVNGEPWNMSAPASAQSDHSFIILAPTDRSMYTHLEQIRLTLWSSDGLKTGDVIVLTVIKRGGANAGLNITNSKLKKNSTIYSNRFVYHPEYNTAATTKELTYYFPDMGGQSNCVSYWDNKGRLVLVEFKKGNLTNVKAKIKKLKNGKKKVIKKAVKKAKYSPGYQHWKYSTAKAWLKSHPTYVIVELKKPIEYIIDERMGEDDVDDSSELQQMLYEILSNYPTSIDDKIYLTSSKYSTDTVIATLQASYTKNIAGRYEYYNDIPNSLLTFNNCYPMNASWMRVVVPYSRTPYRAISIKMNESDDDYGGPIVVDIGTENNFYGGYIDVTNGTVIFTYDANGALTYTSTNDEAPLSGKTYYILSGGAYIEFTGTEFESGETYYEIVETENADIIDDVEIGFQEGENTIEVSSIIGDASYVVTADDEPQDGKDYYTKSNDEYVLFEGEEFESGETYYEQQDTVGLAQIDRIIYPVMDGTILDRMNLKIEHDNYYVGI